MKYKCCDYLLHELVFAQNKIIPCCCSPKHEYNIVFSDDLSGNQFNTDEYIQKRNKYVDLFKQGKIPEACEGCNQIKEQNWDESFFIKRIIITNRTKCSCNCIYCSLVTTSTQTKEELNTREPYDIIPILKNLHSINIIKDNCIVSIAGGECCEYPKGELEYIIYFALIHNCKIEIFSSGIIYSKAIESALKTSNTILKISVDSGKKSTYEIIKRVKAFDNVWKNIEDYIKACSKNKLGRVIVKYIILPKINDNISEIKAFIKRCKSVNCYSIELSIEYLWFEKNKDNPPYENLIKIVRYIKKSGLIVGYENHCMEYLDNI